MDEKMHAVLQEISRTVDGIDPVSYTHLDVYKRQHSNGSISQSLYKIQKPRSL